MEQFLIKKCSIYILTKIGINIEQFLIKKCSILQKTCINIGNRNIGQKNSKHDRYTNFYFRNIGNRNNGQWNKEQ